IVRLLTLGDLLKLSAIPRIQHSVRKHLKGRVSRTLVSFRLREQDTLNRMIETGTVLSGSAALEIVSPGTCKPRDLNFYCPSGAAQRFISLILETEGFVEENKPFKVLMAERTPFSRFEVNNGVKRLYRLVHLSSKMVVNVVESVSASPIAPLLFFHSTLLMNYVSGDSVVSLYPSLTYEGTG
ncbi:hypothetical protein DFP72DRAFT_1117584, partial [Ephemerocybe angulata]